MEAKNKEGYLDLTPFKAMINETEFVEGAIYAKKTYSGIVGDPGFWLIIRSHWNNVNVLSVYETTYKYYKPTEHYTFKHDDREYYVEPSGVLTFNNAKVGEFQFIIDGEDFLSIKREIVRAMRLDEGLEMSDAQRNQSDAVSYLREIGWLKEHDAGILAIKPEEVTVTDLDVDFIRRERDIWKEAFYAVCGRK